MIGDVGDFRRDNGSRFFNVDVWLYARVMYKFGSLITAKIQGWGRREEREISVNQF